MAHEQKPLSQSQALHTHDSSPQVLHAQAAAGAVAAGFTQQKPLRGCAANEAVDTAAHAPLGQASQVQASPEQSGHWQSAQPQSAAFATVALEFANPIAPAQINVAVARTAGME